MHFLNLLACSLYKYLNVAVLEFAAVQSITQMTENTSSAFANRIVPRLM